MKNKACEKAFTSWIIWVANELVPGKIRWLGTHKHMSTL